MKRRSFIALIGGAAAWPMVTHAQQATPVIGYLDNRSPETTVERLRGFHRGLKESGYIEGENLTILYRWAEGDNSRLPGLAADLVNRRVAVITSTGGGPSTLAAKAATETIPIVFTVPEDPVKLGLVSSLAHPDRNLTGVNFLNLEVVAKRLEILHELVPTAAHVAVLVNPTNSINAATTAKEAKSAALSIGLNVLVYEASTAREIDAAFAAMARERCDAVFVSGDGFFNSRRLQIGMLAMRYTLPSAFTSRDYPAFGGLMSYGADVIDAFRQAGLYAGRILKGAKPADLPVVQSTKFELVINHQTARTLGLPVPPSLLARADEVIE
jgi:putative tryptophan/tyrosine transport system substrate-binding protein